MRVSLRNLRLKLGRKTSKQGQRASAHTHAQPSARTQNTTGDEFGHDLAVLLGLEDLVGLRGHLPRLGEPQALLVVLDVRHARLTVRRIGTGDLVESLADDGLGDEELGLAVLGRAELVQSCLHGLCVASHVLHHTRPRMATDLHRQTCAQTQQSPNTAS